MGAGTGLLSLMLAQAVPAHIDALELDEDAFAQAGENFAASPWAQRLRVIHADARSFRSEQPYPFIITNPPFTKTPSRAARLPAMPPCTPPILISGR
ncbi:methyltransferase [Chitinophaga sedimenti]|uniref:methyltransferase n=1 Tax=Chitinophaga sedimenti TaxID=2033606 RepID=UPI0027E1D45D|nr:methyltransferase [Chitinophaga sedimenti]